MRIFYAHSSSDSPKDIGETAKRIKSLVTDKLILVHGNAPAVHVVAGRDDHKRHWKGDWKIWQESVTERKSAISGKSVYDMFVVKITTCGRATAEILGKAISQKKSVFFLGENNKFIKVVGVNVYDPEDWSNGFRIVREPEQLALFKETA